MKKQTLLLIFLVSSLSIAQEVTPKKSKSPNKGKFFVYWGWNWADYSNSDIRFKGANYDFTLSDVAAKDKPSKFSLNDHLNPRRITIPQNNYRIGYFFKENYTVSIGVDHMKYIMIANQDVIINGNIAVGNAMYDGTYTNETIQLTEDFLQFEHTDGLNYINIELKRFDEISDWLGIDLEDIELNLTEGLGIGVLFPRTNTSLFGQERHDDFHISGWGVSAGAGVNITFHKHFFIQLDYKIGYIDMPDVKTTLNTVDFASQSFFFFENTFVLGWKFSLF